MGIEKLGRGSLFFATAAITAGIATHVGQDKSKLEEVDRALVFSEKKLAPNRVSQQTTFSELITTDKHKELIKYEDDKNATYDNKICRAYIPKSPEGKPLFILVLGHVEGLDWSKDDSGMVYFYEQLVKEDKGTVLLFRTGLATHEIESMFSSKPKSKYEPKVVLSQTKDIAKEFIQKYKPKEIRCGGFSWGAATIGKLADDDDWRCEVPVTQVIMIDPITLGSLGFGSAHRTLPEFSKSPEQKTLWAYQRDDSLPLSKQLITLQGNYPIKTVKDKDGKTRIIKDERPGNEILREPNTTHLGIIHLPNIRKKVLEFLIAAK